MKFGARHLQAMRLNSRSNQLVQICLVGSYTLIKSLHNIFTNFYFLCPA
jgi:hypothetical protein